MYAAGRSNYPDEFFGLFAVAYEFAYHAPGGLELIYVNIAGNGALQDIGILED